MKRLLLKSLVSPPYIVRYEGADTTTANGGGTDTVVVNVDGGTGGANDTDPEITKLKFSDDQQKFLNKRLKQERERLKGENDKTIAQLRQLQQSQGTTEKQRQELQGRIEELQTQHLSKEELARQEREKQAKAHADAIKVKDGEVETWKNRYTTTTIKREIVDAASLAEAWNPQQIVDALERNTKLVDELDEAGNPTGNLIARVKWTETDSKTQKLVTLDLTVAEAVKKMKDTPEKYGNLFKSGVAGGLGQGGNIPGRGGKKDAAKMSTSEYMDARKKDKSLEFTK